MGMGTMPEPDDAKAVPIRLGMTSDQVVTLLGKPDRKAILEGKVLRILVHDDSETELLRNRQVFIYDQTELRVWFMNGQVTGVTKSGIEVLN